MFNFTPPAAGQGRPRIYNFHLLEPGDVLSAPLNATGSARGWNSLANSARHYRDTHNPAFDFIIFREPEGEGGFLHVERLPDGLKGKERTRYIDCRTLYRAHHIRRRRRLSLYEIAKAMRASARLQRDQLEAMA